MEKKLTPAALIVGCLPSFAIFIRGQVEATRVQPFDSSPLPNIPSKSFSRIASSQASIQGRTDGIMLDHDIERGVQLQDNEGNKEPTIEAVASQGWKQRWHHGPINSDSEGTEKVGQDD